MSYGPNFADLFRRSAELVDKVLRGTKPADIPVERRERVDLTKMTYLRHGRPEFLQCELTAATRFVDRHFLL
jgi:hypothetical protein